MNSRSRLFAVLALAAAAVAGAQAFRESVRVGLVWVRLDVRGHDGKPLPDLKASEVRLRVDGKEVPIEALDRIEAAPPAPAAEKTSAAPASPAAFDAASAASAPAAGRSDLYLAILVDETSSGSFDRRDVYRQIESFVRDKAAAGSNVMLERFDGRLRVECGWTTDVGRLLDAARKMSKRSFDSRMPSPAEIADEIRKGRKPRDVEQQIDLAARRSFDGAVQALLQFPDVPGRKGLVWITDGTPLMAPFDLSLMLAGANTGARDSLSLRAEALRAQGENDAAKQIEAQLQDEALSTFTVFGAGSQSTWTNRMAAITRKALELDIAFYPVDSEAIERGTNPGVSSKWPGRSMPGVQGGAAVPYSGSGMTARVAVAQSMETLAATSGGQTILVPNQLSDRLEGVAATRTTGYVLTFRDPAPGDSRFHRIEIAVERPGVKLTYRRGYRVRSEEERVLDAILANLNGAGTQNPLNAKVSFEPVRKDGGRNIVAMRLEYPAPPEARGAGESEREIQVWAICSDNDGNRAKPITRKAKAQSISGEKAGPFVDSLQLGLPPGPYTWSVALKDVPSGLTSFLVVRKDL